MRATDSMDFPILSYGSVVVRQGGFNKEKGILKAFFVYFRFYLNTKRISKRCRTVNDLKETFKKIYIFICVYLCVYIFKNLFIPNMYKISMSYERDVNYVKNFDFFC